MDKHAVYHIVFPDSKLKTKLKTLLPPYKSIRKSDTLKNKSNRNAHPTIKIQDQHFEGYVSVIFVHDITQFRNFT
jgi:hypothetical protein